MLITTAQGAYNTGYSGSTRPIIQNIGPGDLYIYTDSTDIVSKGIWLPAGAVYEFAAPIVEGAGAVWIQADGSNCEVRIINVG
jgi:hypothetical protein